MCFRILADDFFVVGIKHGIGTGRGTANGKGVTVLYMGIGNGT